MSETDGAADDREPIHVAFVCVQNAGRSQMSTAFAERERERRGLEDAVEIHTGGTDPADHVHESVVETMAETDVEEFGIDLAEREPREIATEELEGCDYVATMGCSTLELEADGAGSDAGSEGSDVDVRDWALADPDGQDPERVREIRDEVERRVSALFDEVEGELGADGGKLRTADGETKATRDARADDR